MKRFLIAFLNFLIVLMAVCVALIILEIAYRNQWIDFYKYELCALNATKMKSTSKKILVFGDSFSAQQDGYVQVLKDSLAEYEIVNCAIPGTSMREMSLIAANRLKEFVPDKVILQVYPGNDLIDILHPYNSKTISFTRNLYWKISDEFYSVAWLNYKLGHIRTRLDPEQKFVTPSNLEEFSATGYNGRVKLLAKADSDFIRKSLSPTGGKYKLAFEKMSGFIKEIQSVCMSYNPEVEIYLLYIPHCTEVSETYRKNYIELGAQLDNEKNSESEFYQGLQKSFQQLSTISATKSLMDKEASGRRMYFNNDEHLNKEGQKAIGNLMLGLIR